MISHLNLSRLIDYLLATGDYADPETRVPLSEETLQRLDVFGKRLGKPSVIEARVARAREYKEEHVKRDIMASLESVVGECVAQMYDAIERVNDGDISVEDATVQLFTESAPLLEESFKQLALVDVENARLIASSMEIFLRGPSQRPTRDRYNFLPTVLHIFHTACGQS